MKIINRTAFLAMPEGTVYAKIPQKWMIEDLCVKHETSPHNDWWYQSFDWVDAHDSGEAIDRLDEMADSGASYPVENSIARDVLFEDDCLFLIYEKDDIEYIVNALRGTQS